MWMWVIVGSSSASSDPSNAVVVSSSCSYSTGLPSSRDQDGWLPHFARYSGTASRTS